MATDVAVAAATKMLEAAKQFHAAAVACGMGLDTTDPREWLPYPEIVNYAFAVELALKGLQSIHLGAPSRGHDLAKLGAALPACVVDRVRGQHVPPVLFADRLHDVRNAFEVWRYAFEHGQMRISVTFLGGLAESAIAVLRDDLAVAAPDGR